MNTIIITGATGFIGRNLARYAAQQGAEVYAVSRSGLREEPEPGNIHNIICSAPDYSGLADKLPGGADAFIHLAWAGVSPEERESTGLQEQNISMSLNAARLAAEVGAQRFVVPGSTMEYAASGRIIDKDTPPSPLNAYSSAKIAVRYMCRSLCRELELPYIYAVICGIYGGARGGSNVISYTIDKLLQGEKPSLTSLEQTWDYVHIDDVVRALYLICLKGQAGAFYGIGRGDNQPLNKYITTIRDIIDPSLPLGIGEIPSENTRRTCSCVNMDSIMADTGYAPQVSFEDGIRGEIELIKKLRGL